MIDFLMSINWDVDPVIVTVLGRPIVWYGLCWATGVGLTALIVKKLFKADKFPEDWFDSFFMYIVTTLIIGARLGHCLFYDPIEYLSNPIDLIKVWEGGLSSHGGAIGMLIGVCLFSLKKSNKKINYKILGGAITIGAIAGLITYKLTHLAGDGSESLQLGSVIMGMAIGGCISMVYMASPMCIKMLDRLIIGVCVGATLIRIGNLMNSEIYGGPTDLPWGFNFVRDRAWHLAGGLPSHPTQIYEALVYFSLFIILSYMYWKTKAKEKVGLILGVALLGIFGSRILIESIKNVQVSFESNMFLNLGQLLSIPFVIWSLYLIYNAVNNKKTK